MKDAVKNFNNVNPFKIAKWISTFGKDISVNKSRKDGSLTVNCKNSLAYSKLMKCKTFMDENIIIVPHKFLNTTRGIFRCAELEDVEDEEIMEDLSKQSVINLRRIVPRRKGVRTVFVATFLNTVLPYNVKIAYMSLPISPYIPLPMRCFKCHKINHTARSCKVTKDICGKCAEEKHDGECKFIKCSNCGMEHFAWDRTCAVYKKEINILRKMTLERLTYAEAKRRLDSSDNETYAAKTKTESMNEGVLLKRLDELSSKMESILKIINQKQITEICTRTEDAEDRIQNPSEKVESVVTEIERRLEEIEGRMSSAEPETPLEKRYEERLRLTNKLTRTGNDGDQLNKQNKTQKDVKHKSKKKT